MNLFQRLTSRVGVVKAIGFTGSIISLASTIVFADDDDNYVSPTPLHSTNSATLTSSLSIPQYPRAPST